MELTENDKKIIRELAGKRPSTPAEMERKRHIAEGGAFRSNPKSKKRPRVKKKPDFDAKKPKNAHEKGRNAIIIKKNARSLLENRQKNPFSKLEESL